MKYIHFSPENIIIKLKRVNIMTIWKLKSMLSLVLVIIALTCQGNPSNPENISANQPEDKTETKPFTVFQFSFFSPLQIFRETTDVSGLRLTLPYGKNADIKGLDLGIANDTDNLYGISLAAMMSRRTENMYGFTFSGFLNLSEGDDIGLSIAGIYNQVNQIDGLQYATLYNQAKMVRGVQFGLVNYCHDMRGAQIGIFNVCKSQPFPFTLLFNFWK